MSLGPTYSPIVPVGGAASYKLRLVFTYSNGYWEVYRRFHRDFFGWAGGEKLKGVTWEDLSMEEFVIISMKGAQDFLALLKK